jgi:hypothetical protein
MRKLRGGISAKITDAACGLIDRPDELFRIDSFSQRNLFSMGPVLAEETIKGTPMIEDCEILESIFWALDMGELRVARSHSSRANPVGHTVRGQTVMVPTDTPLVFGCPLKAPVLVNPQAAVP